MITGLERRIFEKRFEETFHNPVLQKFGPQKVP
jgi:hypothetical protein